VTHIVIFVTVLNELSVVFTVQLGLDCSLMGAIAMHYAHLGLELGLGLAIVFIET